MTSFAIKAVYIKDLIALLDRLKSNMARRRYEIFVRGLREDEGRGYLATVPELPGCMSDGETDAEAVENVRGAIVSWIEQATAIGREIPTPMRRHVDA